MFTLTQKKKNSSKFFVEQRAKSNEQRATSKQFPRLYDSHLQVSKKVFTATRDFLKDNDTSKNEKKFNCWWENRRVAYIAYFYRMFHFMFRAKCCSKLFLPLMLLGLHFVPTALHGDKGAHIKLQENTYWGYLINQRIQDTLLNKFL